MSSQRCPIRHGLLQELIFHVIQRGVNSRVHHVLDGLPGPPGLLLILVDQFDGF